jgi:hypothetical protein
MISVQINFSSVAEAAAFFAPHATIQMPAAVTGKAAEALLGQVNAGAVADKVIATAQSQVASTAATTGDSSHGYGDGQTGAADAKEDKRPRGRKPKETPVAAEPEKESAPNTASVETSTKEYTIDDVRTALQEYTSKHDFAKGVELVKSFNASRVSDIPADQYAAFIAKAGE